ncbi:hypothetical protein [Candidatus Nitrotoga sp. M5]|uniref:hypothetical protein n=1 Tax=Candidatus Nitrotoga sp. M5 TaxID=2890409 RepID=UPI001EF41519|nr:hypothetical protein [Candidatus Nitrotoga sp. M5]CAH1387517.1 conserved hypothetical protein [Candidatus Nitrotoga sp. M5]
MISSILCFFETFQTFFTGLLGFTGVIITMIVNANHQTKLHAQKIEHERTSLRMAIKSELISNKNTYEARIEQFNEQSEYKNALIQNYTVDHIYKTLLDKIGLLTEEEVESIIKAYLLMSDLPYRLRIVVGTENIGGFNDEFIRLKKEHLAIATDLHKGFLPAIINAIDSINRNID